MSSESTKLTYSPEAWSSPVFLAALAPPLSLRITRIRSSDYYAYREYNEEGDHWYSRTDGHAYTMTRYEDLGFLALMPNLKQLYFACMEAGVLPDLSGSIKLESV